MADVHYNHKLAVQEIKSAGECICITCGELKVGE